MHVSFGPLGKLLHCDDIRRAFPILTSTLHSPVSNSSFSSCEDYTRRRGFEAEREMPTAGYGASRLFLEAQCPMSKMQLREFGSSFGEDALFYENDSAFDEDRPEGLTEKMYSLSQVARRRQLKTAPAHCCPAFHGFHRCLHGALILGSSPTAAVPHSPLRGEIRKASFAGQRREAAGGLLRDRG